MSQKIDDMFAADLKDLANPSRVKLAEADKTAVIGPLLEVANVGIPSGIGYAIGANKAPVSEGEARRQLDSGYSIGKGLLVPGYTGYRAGKNSAAREMLRAAESKKKKGKKEAALSPEMAFNAGRVKGAQDPSRPGAETPENLKAVERMRPNKPSPLTDKIEAAKKQASADELFAAELCQAVGLDVPEAYVDFQRPQVKIAGSASDAIDNHFRSWMQKKAGEDAVKVAMCGADHKKLKTGAKCEKCGEMAKEAELAVPVSAVTRLTQDILDRSHRTMFRRMAATGAVGSAGGVAAGGALGYHLGKKKGQKKTAGVIEHDENLDLLAKIRARAAQGLGLTGDG